MIDYLKTEITECWSRANFAKARGRAADFDAWRERAIYLKARLDRILFIDASQKGQEGLYVARHSTRRLRPDPSRLWEPRVAPGAAWSPL